VKWRRSYNCRRTEADQVLVTGAAPTTGTGTGVLRSTDRLLPASMPPTFGKSPVKKGVTFNLENDDDDDDKTISPPLRDTCRYCTVSWSDKNLIISYVYSTVALVLPLRDGTGSPGHQVTGSTILAGSGRVGSWVSVSDPVFDPV